MKWLLIALLLVGCSGIRHARLAERHKLKAQQKGVVYATDTAYQYVTQYDTLLDPVTNTLTVVQRVVDSVPIFRDRVVYVPKTRIDMKMQRDTLRFMQKVYRSKQKTEQKKKFRGWVILLFGFIAGASFVLLAHKKII